MQEDLPWNIRWNVIGIMTYTISTIIEETSDELKRDNPDLGALREWDDTAIEEIKCGESDARNLLNVNPSHALTPSGGERIPPYDGDNRDDIDDNAGRNDFERPESCLDELVLDDYDDDYDPFEGVDEVVGV